MRGRITAAGVLAGAICAAALYIPYYRFKPAEFVVGWPYAIQAARFPPWLPQVVLFFCAVTLFAFGWVAARWNWAKNWKASTLAGAGAGILAGCLIYGFIGVFWFGLLGQAEIFKNFYLPVTEPEGIKIIVSSIFITGNLLYSNCFNIILACAGLSALGGLASALVDVKDVWGSNPRQTPGWLFRMTAYLLTILGYANMIVTIAVLQTLWKKTLDSMIKLDKDFGIQPDLDASQIYFLLLAGFVGYFFTFLSSGITWGWIIRSWRVRGSLGILALMWLATTMAGTVYLGGRFISRSLSLFVNMRQDSIFIGAGLLLLLAPCAGLLIGFITENSTGDEPYRLTDWLGYLIAYGVLGGAQVVMGAPAMAIPLALIAIVNIPHLTGTGIVEKSPVEQVTYLFGLQIGITRGVMVGSMIIGLIAAWIVGWLRRIFGMRDKLPE